MVVSDASYTTQQAETAIVFQVCALAEVGNIKNNLIAVSTHSECALTLRTQGCLDARLQCAHVFLHVRAHAGA